MLTNDLNLPPNPNSLGTVSEDSLSVSRCQSMDNESPTSPIDFSYSSVCYSPTTSSPSPLSFPVGTDFSTASTYAKLNKTPSPRASSACAMQKTNNTSTSQAKDNLAYLNDDLTCSDTPAVPERIYDRLPSAVATASAAALPSNGKESCNMALPPPVAFSDCDLDEQKRDIYGDTFKDYIDIDKASLNNNNSDAMSFYSDNYVRPATLGLNSSSRGNHLRPSMMSTSIYSSGSSGISINSIEVSDFLASFLS